MSLLHKYLSKLKLFLKQKSTYSKEIFLAMVSNIFTSLVDYFNNFNQEKKDDSHKEIVEFFFFVSTEFIYDVEKSEQVNLKFYI